MEGIFYQEERDRRGRKPWKGKHWKSTESQRSNIEDGAKDA